jgi:hypothetical protein
VVIGGCGGLEPLVILGILQGADDRLCCKPMANGVAAGGLFASFRFRSRALERVTPVGLDRQQVVAKTRIPWRGFGGAGAACTRQRSSSAVSFPGSATKFPASARPIPCLIATGIQPQCFAFTPDSTALQDAERQERTNSPHISLLQGTQPSIDQIANASWLTCRAWDAPRIGQNDQVVRRRGIANPKRIPNWTPQPAHC